MKTLFATIICLITLSSTSIAQDNNHWETDLMTAVERSQKEAKPVMMFFTGSDWCGWCKKLQREVFFKDDFKTWADANVVLLELDFPRRTAIAPELKKQNGELQQMFAVRGYPTIHFVNPTINKETNQVNFENLGKTGYVAGGPAGWLAEAKKYVK